jgi:hypothetical protein
VPRDLAETLPPTVTAVAIAVPAGPCPLVLRLFVVEAATVRLGKKVATKPAAAGATRRKFALVQTPAPVCDAWAYLPAPALLPPPGLATLSFDDVERLLARALQAAAEWLYFAAAPLSGETAATAAALLGQYGGDAGALADTFFAALVLPLAAGARLPCHKLLRTTALGALAADAKVVVTAWDELLAAASLAAWIAAGRAQAAAFEHAAPADQVERVRRAALDAHVGTFRTRLPAQALRWVHESRAWTPGTPDDLLTALTGEGPGSVARDYAHMRADIGRWAIVHARLRPPPAADVRAHWEQQRLLAAPFVASWNDAVAGRRWVQLARAAARHSGLALVQGKAVDATANLAAGLAQRRRAVAQYYRDRGMWLAPKDAAERADRFVAIGADSAERLAQLFGSAWTPPCIRALLARARSEHHLAGMDRFAIASWLVALQPPDGAGTAVQMLAEFALGLRDGTANVLQYAEELEAMRGAVEQAVAKRAENPQGMGPACNGIITWTLTPPDERHACRCPHAALRAGVTDNKPCAQACAAAAGAGEKGPRVPVTFHPMQRLLWARETGRLEW